MNLSRSCVKGQFLRYEGDPDVYSFHTLTEDEASRVPTEEVSKVEDLEKELKKNFYAGKEYIYASPHSLINGNVAQPVTSCDIELQNSDKSTLATIGLLEGDMSYTEYKKIIESTLKSKNGKMRRGITYRVEEGTLRLVVTPQSIGYTRMGDSEHDTSMPVVTIPMHVAKRIKIPRWWTKTTNRRGEVRWKYHTVKYTGVVDGDVAVLIRSPTMWNRDAIPVKIVVSNVDCMGQLKTDGFVTSGTSIRFPISLTGPYNADFDGDEVLLVFITSKEAVRELERIHGIGQEETGYEYQEKDMQRDIRRLSGQKVFVSKRVEARRMDKDSFSSALFSSTVYYAGRSIVGLCKGPVYESGLRRHHMDGYHEFYNRAFYPDKIPSEDKLIATSKVDIKISVGKGGEQSRIGHLSRDVKCSSSSFIHDHHTNTIKRVVQSGIVEVSTISDYDPKRREITNPRLGLPGPMYGNEFIRAVSAILKSAMQETLTKKGISIVRGSNSSNTPLRRIDVSVVSCFLRTSGDAIVYYMDESASPPFVRPVIVKNEPYGWSNMVEGGQIRGYVVCAYTPQTLVSVPLSRRRLVARNGIKFIMKYLKCSLSYDEFECMLELLLYLAEKGAIPLREFFKPAARDIRRSSEFRPLCLFHSLWYNYNGDFSRSIMRSKAAFNMVKPYTVPEMMLTNNFRTLRSVLNA